MCTAEQPELKRVPVDHNHLMIRIHMQFFKLEMRVSHSLTDETWDHSSSWLNRCLLKNLKARPSKNMKTSEMKQESNRKNKCHGSLRRTVRITYNTDKRKKSAEKHYDAQGKVAGCLPEVFPTCSPTTVLRETSPGQKYPKQTKICLFRLFGRSDGTRPEFYFPASVDHLLPNHVKLRWVYCCALQTVPKRGKMSHSKNPETNTKTRAML